MVTVEVAVWPAGADAAVVASWKSETLNGTVSVWVVVLDVPVTVREPLPPLRPEALREIVELAG